MHTDQILLDLQNKQEAAEEMANELRRLRQMLWEHTGATATSFGVHEACDFKLVRTDKGTAIERVDMIGTGRATSLAKYYKAFCD